MNRSIRRLLQGAVFATALAASAPQAFAATAPGIGTPPAGYVHEPSFHGTATACRAAGAEGIADGKWTAYFCYQELPFTPFQKLYVKK
ncbi:MULTISPECIES: hypothetical protein [unclassified Streptomyces]|uniref:hypothetical protein n=1 Tax=unclassified Streptomyces TaxID=2593676 RepID=UPI001BED06BB|nr:MULTISPECIES: hypothetical protein [unclassified Streptomyces]MBT2406303.1 hypothetical protein [Streptomyces sp. ISL-21]MBT2607380.1 hypothetical protein [Streptomyces sp. ISL-87]